MQSTNTDSNEFLFEIQQPARNVDQSEPLFLSNLLVLAPSNALPTRLTAAHLRSDLHLHKDHEEIDVISSFVCVCINPVPVRSQKVVAFILRRLLSTVHGIHLCAPFNPPNRQRSNATHTLNMMFLPSEEKMRSYQHTNFASDMTSVAAHSCSNSGASASEGREPRSLNLCRNLKPRFYSNNSSSISSRVGSSAPVALQIQPPPANLPLFKKKNTPSPTVINLPSMKATSRRASRRQLLQPVVGTHTTSCHHLHHPVFSSVIQ